MHLKKLTKAGATMVDGYKGIIDTKGYSKMVTKLRNFCLEKGFFEVNTQDRLSILAACEDPETVATFEYLGQKWPLPQTGQMWLEHELLTKPDLPGVFCISTSYRNEKNPIPGRHKLIFPMFEFEFKGDIDDLIKFETELLEYLGFGDKKDFKHKKYDELKIFYKTNELTHEHENKMLDDFGSVVFCKEFPVYTSPFWNMKMKNETHANKVDVIIYGNETIGSAERSVSMREMAKGFYSVSKGNYAQKLFELFGKERVENEMSDYLTHKFFTRYGGGIGLTRLLDAMQKAGI